MASHLARAGESLAQGAQSVSAAAAPAACTPDHPRTHANADKQTVFQGLAAYAAKSEVRPLAYNPHQLDGDFIEIEIDCCGICGSDIHTIDSGWGPTDYPVIVGHEVCGSVVAVGSAVKLHKVGDRVGVGAQCGSCLDRTETKCEECATGWQQHCRVCLTWTYNGKYPDGQVSQGGYADRIRVNENFAFALPDAISSVEAAPLMCAGSTVFAPLKRYVTKPGMRVAVIGIGGLGHLGVMFASKFHGGSISVTGVSHNAKKKADALQMGAKDFLDTSDEAQVKANFRRFDFVLCTANGSKMDMSKWLSTVRLGGTFCSVGLPEEPFAIPPFSLVGAQVNFTASMIGSISEIKEMLAFAVEHHVRPIVERMPMEKANEGIQKMREGNVRYRIVLENPPKA